jgi:hypothetical protein
MLLPKSRLLQLVFLYLSDNLPASSQVKIWPRVGVDIGRMVGLDNYTVQETADPMSGSYP